MSRKVIAISISDSEDLSKLGFGKCHLEDALIEICRFLIQQGYSIAYGGDLRYQGFTQHLFDLANSYRSIIEEPIFHSFLGFPIGDDLSEADEAMYFPLVKFHKIGLPNDLKGIDSQFMKDDEDEESRYHWFRSMTEMRTIMNSKIDARIILGGQSKKFKSKMPGVLEETLIALRNGKPVFLCGAFGGAAGSIIESMQNGKSAKFDLAYFASEIQYLKGLDLYNRRHPLEQVSYESIVIELKQFGADGLHNGLSMNENLRLFQTPFIHEMISLILKGLKQKFN